PLKRLTTMTPSSSLSEGRSSISTVPSCVYPFSMSCTFAQVHSWAQGDSRELRRSDQVLSVTCFRLLPCRDPSQVVGSRLPGGRGVRDLPGAVAMEEVQRQRSRKVASV